MNKIKFQIVTIIRPTPNINGKKRNAHLPLCLNSLMKRAVEKIEPTTMVESKANHSPFTINSAVNKFDSYVPGFIRPSLVDS